MFFVMILFVFALLKKSMFYLQEQDERYTIPRGNIAQHPTTYMESKTHLQFSKYTSNCGKYRNVRFFANIVSMSIIL